MERVIREGGRAVICDLPTSQGAKVADGLGSNAVFAPTDVSSFDKYFLIFTICITFIKIVFYF